MQADFTHLNVIAALVNRFEDWLWKQPRQHEIEAYLATSQNLFELEERLRDLGRAPTCIACTTSYTRSNEDKERWFDRAIAL
jgi:hypothetical protein